MQNMKLMGLAAGLSTLIASSAMAQQYADPNYWVGIGYEQFKGQGDQETTFADWGGRSVEKIGLKAIGDEANCTRVSITYGNGRTEPLSVGRLASGHIIVFDLPGRQRNIRAINLACHAMNKRKVSIEIFVRK